MPLFTDQTGRQVNIPEYPQRIISLVPSQTELLADLQLEDRVTGITKFCVHPERWFHSKTRIGGTKKIDAFKIHSLQPDLIIANKEENLKEEVELLAADYPVWVSDVNDLDSAINMIRSIGIITGTIGRSEEIVNHITSEFATLIPLKPVLRAAYLIWREPYMTCGRDTFIQDMMSHCGFINIFQDHTRYPVTDIKTLIAGRPDVILLSSEPYPFREKHILELAEKIPGVKILLADGEMFSWYGSRLQYAPAYFHNLQQQLS